MSLNEAIATGLVGTEKKVNQEGRTKCIDDNSTGFVSCAESIDMHALCVPRMVLPKDVSEEHSISTAIHN